MLMTWFPCLEGAEDVTPDIIPARPRCCCDGSKDDAELDGEGPPVVLLCPPGGVDPPFCVFLAISIARS